MSEPLTEATNVGDRQALDLIEAEACEALDDEHETYGNQVWAAQVFELVAEVRRLRDGIATQRDAALSETVDCYDCCTGCPMEPEDYPDWLTATWALAPHRREPV